MVDCGVEGFKTYGIITNGNYNIAFDSCYFESNEGVGFSGRGTNSVTFNNCWGFGDFPMIGDFTDNTNVRVNPNNVLGNNCRWFDSLPAYCISDFHLQNQIQVGNQIIPTAKSGGNNYPDAVNLTQDLTVYRASAGLNGVQGRVEQTNRYHTQRVNGSIGRGFFSSEGAVGFTATQEDRSAGFKGVVYDTGITYTDTQLVYVCCKVAYSTSTWIWFGNIVGDYVVPIYTNGSDPTITNNAGLLQISSPDLPTSGNLGISVGEIRII